MKIKLIIFSYGEYISSNMFQASQIQVLWMRWYCNHIGLDKSLVMNWVNRQQQSHFELFFSQFKPSALNWRRKIAKLFWNIKEIKREIPNIRLGSNIIFFSFPNGDRHTDRGERLGIWNDSNNFFLNWVGSITCSSKWFGNMQA